MNCANHPERERVAFCQNCGKPLCPECSRALGTAIFCEPCFLARTAPGTGPYPGAPPVAGPGPNPGLAALLGFIPGVGAMYNEQYGKGIVHLMVFAILVSLTKNVNGLFMLFVFGWIFYMVIEAHHTARARRDGTPLPNPFGLNDLSERLGFGKSWPSAGHPFQAQQAPPAGDPAAYAAQPPYTPPATPPYTPTSAWSTPPASYAYAPIPPMPPMPDFDPNAPHSRSFPSGAVWLIGLGVLFLLGNIGIFHALPVHLFGPCLLIGLGVYLFIHRMTSNGAALADDGTPAYRQRLLSACNSSVWVTLSGVLWLLDSLRILSWSHSWPVYLIAVGVLMLFKRTGYSGAGYGGYPGYDPATGQPWPRPAAPASAPGTAIVPVHDGLSPIDSNRTPEGR
jgi:hypothetical protein